MRSVSYTLYTSIELLAPFGSPVKINGYIYIYIIYGKNHTVAESYTFCQFGVSVARDQTFIHFWII